MGVKQSRLLRKDGRLKFEFEMIQIADSGKVETGASAVCSRSLCACTCDVKGHTSEICSCQMSFLVCARQ